MSMLDANSQIYSVVNENELAIVLSHYSSEFVFSVVDDAIRRRFIEVPIIPLPNVVGAWEQNFKVILNTYGESAKEEIMNVRDQTYREIIGQICKTFNLNYTVAEDVDIYSAAFILYDFFISNFSNNLITFFARYCYNQRADLYDMLNLAELKKNKDISTLYGKKVYKDLKLAIINANIDRVIPSICSMDIDLSTITTTVIDSPDQMRYLLSLVSARGDFFHESFSNLMNSEVQPEIITAIRFKLQEIAVAHDQAITNTSEFNTMEATDNE